MAAGACEDPNRGPVDDMWPLLYLLTDLTASNPLGITQNPFHIEMTSLVLVSQLSQLPSNIKV